MRYFIVDDDRASRAMLTQIIEDSQLGTVIGEASNGQEAITQILVMQPDFVIIDLLMPILDGLATIEQLRENLYDGKFIMISQVINKEMVAQAYEKGIEFFIHKPINKVEVEMVLRKTEEQYRLKSSISAIRQSLSNFETPSIHHSKKSTRDHVLSILNDMGIIGEVGSEDITKIIELLMADKQKNTPLPPLKELYERVAGLTKTTPDEIIKESKSIEQRIRRTILAAMINLANLGLVDYTNSEFEYYAPRYFEFTEIRKLMNQIRNNEERKVKINIKKFIQVLFADIVNKAN
ncbi:MULTISPECIES: response regulator [Ureibacillus]|uniref:Two-component system response regulator YcbB n=1 Tax=Ureibacillus thermosphaericus TaxID=51173 RepID=A0A840PWQ3_URETH|nr:response regulator [Ureibacillus thermosphaericus]MBB5150300.1 two-component system response regulator YcbB [Ureibacillus thermosphaericus]NKZ32898.1 response regulator [Ureibacillus thermosphaericus]